MRGTLTWLVLGVLAGLLTVAMGGCRAKGEGSFRVAPGQYARAFDAAREELRARRFSLERVDAAEGVITTQAKPTAGLATPWDGEQSSARQEVEDWVNQQKRTVRVTFEPGEGSDLEHGEVTARVWVTVWRTQWAHVRPSSKSVTLTTTAWDPTDLERGRSASYDVARERDETLEARLAQAIEQRLATATAAAP